MARKYVIGVTGNIATGKSTLLGMLRELGAAVINADDVTRLVMRRGEPAYEQIVAAFGSDILRADGEIDRAALGRRVFSDADAMRRLEAIVHPATIARIERQIEEANAAVVVIEAIKLIESGMVARLCDALWVIEAPAEQQLERLVAMRGMSRQDALQRISAQGPQADKVKAADVVIHNDGSVDDLRRRVLEAWQGIPAEFRQDMERPA
jgi:dephospho-CoA kinase